jgi:hypothetical protein
VKEKPHYKKGEHSPLQSTKTLPFLGSAVSSKGVMELFLLASEQEHHSTSEQKTNCPQIKH